MERPETLVWDAYARALPSMLEAVGRTPLVRLSRVGPEGLSLLAKIEWYGPTGSVKDRIYRHMIERAEERGDLRPGMTIMESTTGNAGIACSAVAAIKGYDCIDRDAARHEHRTQAHDRGLRRRARPHARRRHRHRPGDREDARDRRDRPGALLRAGGVREPRQPRRAAIACGEEIWEQCGGQVDAVVAAQGTGGWVTGVARALKSYDRAIRAYAVEPAESPLIWSSGGAPTASRGSATGSSRATSICP